MLQEKQGLHYTILNVSVDGISTLVSQLRLHEEEIKEIRVVEVNNGNGWDKSREKIVTPNKVLPKGKYHVELFYRRTETQ